MRKHRDKSDTALRLVSALFVASLFIAAFSPVGDPDAWLHLSIGRLLWQAGALPGGEPFAYPNFGTEFSDNYPFWLFGLLSYAAYLALGGAGLVALKAALASASFAVLLKDSLRPYGNRGAALIVLSAASAFVSYRFSLRPEMAAMLYLSFCVFSLNAYMYEKKRYIYALPLIHALWVNTHSSIALMWAPFAAFIAGGLLQGPLGRRGIGEKEGTDGKTLGVVALVFAASAAGSLLGPYFAEAHTYAFGVMGLEWNREVTNELSPPAGPAKAFLYALYLLTAASFALNRRRFSCFHLLLVLPFAALSFGADRFRLFAAITAAPVIARNISGFLSGSVRERGAFHRRTVTAVCAACVASSLVLSVAWSGKAKPWVSASGGWFDYRNAPKGAVEFLDREKIRGRAFNRSTSDSTSYGPATPKGPSSWTAGWASRRRSYTSRTRRYFLTARSTSSTPHTASITYSSPTPCPSRSGTARAGGGPSTQPSNTRAGRSSTGTTSRCFF